MRAKFGSDPTAGSKILSFKFISRLRLCQLGILFFTSKIRADILRDVHFG